MYRRILNEQPHRERNHQVQNPFYKEEKKKMFISIYVDSAFATHTFPSLAFIQLCMSMSKTSVNVLCQFSNVVFGLSTWFFTFLFLPVPSTPERTCKEEEDKVFLVFFSSSCSLLKPQTFPIKWFFLSFESTQDFFSLCYHKNISKSSSFFVLPTNHQPSTHPQSPEWK